MKSLLYFSICITATAVIVVSDDVKVRFQREQTGLWHLADQKYYTATNFIGAKFDFYEPEREGLQPDGKTPKYVKAKSIKCVTLLMPLLFSPGLITFEANYVWPYHGITQPLPILVNIYTFGSLEYGRDIVMNVDYVKKNRIYRIGVERATITLLNGQNIQMSVIVQEIKSK